MDDGVFKLRKRFAGRLGPKPKTCADFPDEDVMTLMSQTRMLPRVELLRSMVDVSSLVTFKPSPFVYHSMSDILQVSRLCARVHAFVVVRLMFCCVVSQCDMETAASKDATLLSEVCPPPCPCLPCSRQCSLFVGPLCRYPAPSLIVPWHRTQNAAWCTPRCM